MARPSPAQRDPDNYPHSLEVQSRYSDVDSMGHINNVAIAGLFETARIHFHRSLRSHPSDRGLRWLVAATSLNYLAEMHFPDPVTITSGFIRVGNTSWTIASAAFQDGECCATCESVIVMQGPEGRRQITEDMRERMAPFFVRGIVEEVG